MPVRWVERSETHRLAAAAFQKDDGFRRRSTHPTGRGGCIGRAIRV
jgi:hypothetical protein